VSFAAPLALTALIVIPLLAAGYVLAGRRRQRAAARFANPALVPNLVPSSPGWRRHVPSILVLASLAALVVGIARPHVVRDVKRNEATIVLAIDTSRSMAATDAQPSRFDAARQAAEQFLEDVPEEYSVGIVSFATSADPVLPPTTDRQAARVALRELRLGSGTALGTAVTRAVDVALGRQEQQGAPPPPSRERSPASVLVFSDGAQTAGDVRPVPAAQRARRLGVPVSAVAVGTSNAVVEVPLPRGLKQRVVVTPEPQTLQVIARATGGTFLPQPGVGSLENVYRELGTRLASDRKRVEVTSAFAAGGAVLLLIGGALSSHWFRRAL
jgi:Ca-activated chloride channel family protein